MICAVAIAVAVVAGTVVGCGSAAEEAAVLPVRPGPRTETSHGVPHVQHFVDAVPEIDDELRDRIYSLPGIESRETIVSFSGTTALWLTEDFDFADEQTTLREREFAHIHPDGSLHTVLPVERAREATTAKWAELHPWVGREDFWDGMVMLYTPQNSEELDVTWQLIVESYNFVTGQSVDPSEFAPA